MKHSGDLLEKLRKRKESRFISSFDVKSLYTNIPTQKAMLSLRKILKENENSLPISSQALGDLVEACLEFTLFEYNGNRYKQIRGLKMGSPISPLVACLFLESIEKDKILPNLPKDSLWLRYIDDVLFICNKKEEVENTLEKINNIEDSIKFTVEMEENNELPFLDVKIIKRGKDLIFDVYRKPTNSDNYIHYFSAHSNSTKTGIIIGFFLRAYRICDPIFIDQEITKIYESFRKRDYPNYFINNARRKAEKIYYNPRVKTNDITRISLPKISINTDIQNILGKDIKIVEKMSKTIGSQLRKIPGKINEAEGGIYKIPCKDCNKIYIGETGKNLQTRIKQHRREFDNYNTSNANVVHWLDNGHRINWESASLIKKCNNERKRKIIESAKILCNDTYNLNQNPYNLEKSTAILLNNIYY